MSNQTKAYLYAISAILCWSTIASAFKITLRYLDFINILLFSSLAACIVLFIIMCFQDKLHLLMKLRHKQFLNAAFRGLLNPFLYYVVLLKAYDLLKAQEAGTLNYIWPITLVLLSIPLLKQKIGFTGILAIVISFGGIIVISTEGHLTTFQFRNPTGVILAVGSSIFWALYWILNIRDKTDEVIKLFLNFCFGTIFVLISVLMFFKSAWPSWEGIAGVIYIGTFEMGLTFFLWLMALRYTVNTAKVANLVYLSPFISLVIIRFAIGEKILFSTIAGLILIVTGILLQHFTGQRGRSPVRKGNH